MRPNTLEQATAHDFAGLQVDQLQKLRGGNMTYDQAIWWNNLTFYQRQALMDFDKHRDDYGRKHYAVSVSVPSLIYGVEAFRPKEFYFVGKEVNNSQIAHMNDMFLKTILGKASKKVEIGSGQIQRCSPVTKHEKHGYHELEILYAMGVCSAHTIDEILARIAWFLEDGCGINRGEKDNRFFVYTEDAQIVVVFLSFGEGGWWLNCRYPEFIEKPWVNPGDFWRFNVKH